MNENRPSDFEIGVRVAKVEDALSKCVSTTEWNDFRLGIMSKSILSLQNIIGPPNSLGLLQKLSRWWNRSHYRALEQQLSEIRTKQMKTDEAVSKLTETQLDQAVTLSNLSEGLTEINGLVADLKAKIDALEAAAGNAELPEGIAALITTLAEQGKVAKDRSQEIADIVKPVEPPPAG